jgi:Family of unknown function (DUF6356)
MSLLRAFTDHPASVGETYFEHLGRALGFAARMMLAGIACAIHGVLPFLFVRTGSGVVIDLYDRMVVNRRRTPLSPLAGDKPVPL